ncbi:hypothetical protein O181_079709 [Austropuccinia psidii MF-1]|uniref:Tet-like 2OG-Fe(II) oxygenase domain-containing protein n=1 Tax=Austropuccinia psidii MF-1 TaxID=1389203 RepID=A0A9Q3IIH2_9BASI|nr:hypothetical protein [Austropuccinia psidii MF-1]
MFAIGWRPSRLGQVTIGRYISSSNVSKDIPMYDHLSNRTPEVAKILKQFLQNLSLTIFENKNKNMTEVGTPGFKRLDFCDSETESFSNQLTYTINNFSNVPHCDKTDHS